MKISETCTCGARVEIDTPRTREAEEYVVRWRKAHTHQERTPFPPAPPQ